MEICRLSGGERGACKVSAVKLVKRLNCKALVTRTTIVLDPNASGPNVASTNDREDTITTGVGEVQNIERGGALWVEGIFFIQ